MSGKWHVNKNGDVKPCNAKKRACRYGEHFASEQEMEEYCAKGKADLPSRHKRQKSTARKSFDSLNKREREARLQEVRDRFTEMRLPKIDGTPTNDGPEYSKSEVYTKSTEFLDSLELESNEVQTLYNYSGDDYVSYSQYNNRPKTDEGLRELAKLRDPHGDIDVAVKDLKHSYALMERKVETLNSLLEDARSELEDCEQWPQLYRGIRVLSKPENPAEAREAFVKAFPEGTVYRNEAFISTSANPKVAHSFGMEKYRNEESSDLVFTSFKVYAKPSLSIETVSQLRYERETVIPKDKEFVVGKMTEVEVDGRFGSKKSYFTIELFERELLD